MCSIALNPVLERGQLTKCQPPRNRSILLIFPVRKKKKKKRIPLTISKKETYNESFQLDKKQTHTEDSVCTTKSLTPTNLPCTAVLAFDCFKRYGQKMNDLHKQRAESALARLIDGATLLTTTYKEFPLPPATIYQTTAPFLSDEVVAQPPQPV